MTQELPMSLVSPINGIPIGGFSQVFGPSTDNGMMFQHAIVEPQIDTMVLRGGIASLFCYGYTGGGKTYTLVGSKNNHETNDDAAMTTKDDRGLFFLAAKRILKQLSSSSALQQKKDSVDDRLFLRATVCEIYLDQVFDLLDESGTTDDNNNRKKVPCTIRVDESGKLVIHRERRSELLDIGITDKDLLACCCGGSGGAAGRAAKGSGTDDRHRATLVTLAPGLCTMPIHSQADLDALYEACTTQRTCGTSTVNAQSSRSHAIFRLEVVSTKINQLRDHIQRLKAESPAIENAIDNARHSVQWKNRVDALGTDDADKREAAVKRKKVAIASLRTRLAKTEKDIVRLTTQLKQEVESCPHQALGGSFLLVDLAGADYDHRGGADTHAQKESTAINKSLLALKECFRAIARGDKTPPFRNSKLTRILEDSLVPVEVGKKGTNKETRSVMIVNVSPAANLKSGTVNALRYGQLFSTAEEQGCRRQDKQHATTKTSSVHSKKVGSGSNSSQMSKSLKEARERYYEHQDSQSAETCTVERERIKEEVRSIYQNHVPEKSASDVDAILSRFSGREVMLLRKVKAKYWGASFVVVE